MSILPNSQAALGGELVAGPQDVVAVALAGTSPFMDVLTANGPTSLQPSVTGVTAGKRKFIDDRRDQPFDKRLRFSVRQTESAYRYRDIVVRKQDGFTHILLSTKSSENNSLNPEVSRGLGAAPPAGSLGLEPGEHSRCTAACTRAAGPPVLPPPGRQPSIGAGGSLTSRVSCVHQPSRHSRRRPQELFRQESHAPAQPLRKPHRPSQSVPSIPWTGTSGRGGSVPIVPVKAAPETERDRCLQSFKTWFWDVPRVGSVWTCTVSGL